MRWLFSVFVLIFISQQSFGKGNTNHAGLNFYLRHHGCKPGYIVCRNDTVRGTVSARGVNPFRAHNIIVTTSEGVNHRYRLTNRHINAVALGERGDDIVFKKLSPNTGSLLQKYNYRNKFYRQAFDGKLGVYDNLLTPNTQYFSWDHFLVSYNGKVKAYHPFDMTSAKQKLVQAINECYGLQLDAGAYSPQQLWDFVHKNLK